MEEGYGFRNGDPLMHIVLEVAAALDRPKQNQNFHENTNIVRQQAGKEGEDKDDGGLQCFALLVSSGVRQL